MSLFFFSLITDHRRDEGRSSARPRRAEARPSESLSVLTAPIRLRTDARLASMTI